MATGRTSARDNRNNRAVALAVAALGALAAAGTAGAAAAEEGPTTFLGQKVKPHHGTYLVLKDVNVRAEPETKSKRVASLKAGRRITVVARAAGAWVAVREGGKDMGFVYDQVLLPLIDGTLAKPITGTAVAAGGTKCAYRIEFIGKSPVEGQLFEIADYEIRWTCRRPDERAGPRTGRKVEFETPMFITEAPYQMTSKPVFQISVDLIDLYHGYDDILSTVFLYDRKKGEVAFDSVSIAKYGQAPDAKAAKAKAGNVREALGAAARIAASTWNAAAWSDLIRNIPEEPPEDAKPGKK